MIRKFLFCGLVCGLLCECWIVMVLIMVLVFVGRVRLVIVGKELFFRY